MPINEALELDSQRLLIYSKEANRQRAVDVIWLAKLFGDKEGSIERALKTHGIYTDGFYSNELDRLTNAIGKVKR
jgi:hypothetical protein